MSLFPGFDQIFKLSDPVANRPFRGDFEGPGLGFEVSRGELEPATPPIVRWAMGAAEPGDVIWTTSAHPLIVSGRVTELLGQQHISGWHGVPVIVLSKFGQNIPGYSLLVIYGRCGHVDLTQSAIELRQYPGGLFPHFRGHYFAPDSWDGSDVFMEAPDHLGKTTSTRFVTLRVARLLRRNRIGNLTLTALPDVSVTASVYEVGSKHLLPPDYKERLRAAYKDALPSQATPSKFM
jgi:hypothetical protein